MEFHSEQIDATTRKLSEKEHVSPKTNRMTLTSIWYVLGDDVTVETNDTTKHRAGVSSWKVQLPTAATEPSSKLMGGSFGEQIW